MYCYLYVYLLGWPFGTGQPVGVLLPGKATSLIPSFSQLPVTLSTGLESSALFPAQFGKFTLFRSH